MDSIKALIFDLDDTLYDCNYTNNLASVEAVCRYAAEELLELPAQQVREAFDRAREDIKVKMLGDEAAQHNRMLYFQKTLELLHMSPLSYALEMYEYFWNDFLQRIYLYPGARDLLELWHAQGGRIAICTDMTVHIQHRKLRSLGIDNLIDVLVTSEEVGAEKPAPEIYQCVLDKLGISPKEAVFIGDSLPKDVLGPMEAGIQAIWYLDKRTAGEPSEEQKQIIRDREIRLAGDYETLYQYLTGSQGSWQPAADTPTKRIYEAVKKIPRGRVATYGQIAALAGNPRMSRAVGNALHKNSDPDNVPCYRVVNAKGELAAAFVFGGAGVQQGMLEADGIEVVDGKVDLERYGIEIADGKTGPGMFPMKTNDG